jgi:c-di-GMP-binding flagellar brake protein YcgR
MSDSSTPKSFSEKRSALRAPVPVDVVLKCPDKSGKSFIEKTQTVDISRTGAKTLTEHDVNHGARLQMAVPDQKRMT